MGAMRQCILGSHIPPCHMHVVIATSRDCSAALQHSFIVHLHQSTRALSIYTMRFRTLFPQKVPLLMLIDRAQVKRGSRSPG